MARVNIAAQTAPGGYDANGATLTFTAADATNDHKTAWTGREMILAENTSADTAYSVTITSVADVPAGRTGDTTVSLPFGTKAWFGPFPANGWRQTDGFIYFEAANAAVKFAVIRPS
jgi:hypothetical protein